MAATHLEDVVEKHRVDKADRGHRSRWLAIRLFLTCHSLRYRDGLYQVSWMTTHSAGRHCEERSDEAIQKCRKGTGLLHFARSDGLRHRFLSEGSSSSSCNGARWRARSRFLPPTLMSGGGGHKPKFKMSPAVHLMSGWVQSCYRTASFGRLPPPGRDRPHTTKSRRARARPYASTRRPRRVFDRASGPCQAGTMDGTEKRSRSLVFSMVLGAGP